LRALQHVSRGLAKYRLFVIGSGRHGVELRHDSGYWPQGKNFANVKKSWRRDSEKHYQNGRRAASALRILSRGKCRASGLL
jgi:hypothetical protein